MSARRQIFDAHHHLWDIGHCNYPWLMAKGVTRFFGDPTPIQRNYLTTDFCHDARCFQLAGSTHIQVGVSEDDAVKETLWLEDNAGNEPLLPSAIVAFADLTRDDLSDLLAEHAKATRFRGVRQIIGRHPVEDKKMGTGDLLDNPDFLGGLKYLADHHLSFDLQLVASQYDAAARLFSEVPDLKFAVCHFGSPWDLSLEGFKVWRAAMEQFAGLPGCVLKFSGFGMFKADWTPEDIKPFVHEALEIFGPERCMAGSNFPVDKLYGGYDRIWNALDALIPDPGIRENVMLNTGAQFYGVDVHR